MNAASALNTEKLLSLGRRLYYSVLSRLNTERTCWSCPDELFLPASSLGGHADSLVTAGLGSKTQPLFGKCCWVREFTTEVGGGEGCWEGLECSLSIVMCQNIYGHIYAIVVNFASCFNCLALALMSRDISAPEMGRSALFYFKTNKSSPHTHVLVCLVLDCLVWKEEPEEESLVEGTWKYTPVNILVGKYRTDEIQC